MWHEIVGVKTCELGFDWVTRKSLATPVGVVLVGGRQGACGKKSGRIRMRGCGGVA